MKLTARQGAILAPFLLRLAIGISVGGALLPAHASEDSDYYFRTSTSGLLDVAGSTSPGGGSETDPGTPRQQLTLQVPSDVSLRQYDLLPVGVKVEAINAVGNVSYSVSPSLPSGIMLNSDGSITGAASSLSSETEYTITAVDSEGGSLGSATASFKLAVAARIPVEIAGVTSFAFQKDAGAQSFRLTPGTDVSIHGSATWGVSPSLPGWLSLSYDGNDIIVSGTPTTLDATGFDLNFTLSDDHDSSPQHAVRIKVIPLAGAGIELPDSIQSTVTYLTSYYVDLAANTAVTGANVNDITWSTVLDQPGDAMIPGVKLEQDGTLQGNPLTLGTFAFGVKATAPGGMEDVQRYTVTVIPEIATRVASVTYTTCMQAADGTVSCWGQNTASYGLLGNNSTVSTSNIPVPASALNVNGKMIDIAGGYSGHMCALREDGTVWCWGMGSSGQLGNGANTNSKVPVQVSNLNNVVSISTGYKHSCAIKSDGSMWCWGEGGTVGDGTSTARNTPVQVMGMSSGVISMATGNKFSCAGKADGTAWCWGYNANGRLGDGTTTNSYSPVQVEGLDTVVSMTGGYDHTCAVTVDRTAWCWGAGMDGQLGNGITTQGELAADYLTPVQVQGLTDIYKLTTGDHHTCSIKMDRTLWCWGRNTSGQLGNGVATGYSSVPVQVLNIDNVASVTSLGYMHTCATKTDGSAWCWGTNQYGQLGNGQTGSGTGSSVPVRVSGT